MDSTRRRFLQAAMALPSLPNTVAAQHRSAPPRPLRCAESGLDPRLIYFNTASVGPTPTCVLARTVETWRKLENDPVPMSYYPQPGTVVTDANQVRGKVANLIGCSSEEVLLRSGTTDGITTLAGSIRLRPGDHVLLTSQEHEGGEVGWLYRQRRDAIIVDRVDIPIGDNDVGTILGRFDAAIGPRTRVISVSHVLSPTGLRMPIAELADLARSRGVLLIVDGAQAAGQIPVDVKALGCDAYAASGHKWLLGPKGTGFIYINKDVGDAIEPPQWELGRGYGSNSAGLGPMTLMVGLGAAVDAMQLIGLSRVEQHNVALRNRFYDGLARLPQLRIVSPPPGPSATALVAAILPETIDSKVMRERLHERHHVVVKMAEKRWFNGIRFSPHIFNDETQVDKALAALRSELNG